LLEVKKLGLANQAQEKIFSRRICDLGLKIEGSRLEALIHELYRELDESGLTFHPHAYLSDEWGCPQGVPVIGIPFYLADAKLSKMEGRCTGVAAEDDTEILRLLRHEAGHAFNYAYRLYKTPAWQRRFGKYSKPYREVYPAVPFSSRFVRHVPAWYGQKHPDEDFAETFAVWLTPGSNWQETYAETPALAKLKYVDRTLRRIAKKAPAVNAEKLDRPVREITMTLASWYTSCRESYLQMVSLHNIIDEDLRRLLPEKVGKPADTFIQPHKADLVRLINNWTGIDRHVLSSLLNELEGRLHTLNLRVPAGQKDKTWINLTAFVTALAMNYQCRGRFLEI
jgi:hypothetical protein